MSTVTTQGIFYDPVNHTYHDLLNNRIVSNTELLEAMGFSDYSMVPEHIRIPALEVGKDVHEATALLDKGRPWKKKFSHLAGYVKAWKVAKKFLELRPKLIEEPLWDSTLKIATTPDRWGPSKFGDITVQLKTGKVEPWVGLQLAFEEWCISLSRNGRGNSSIGASSDRRFAIELRSDGTFKPHRFEDSNDIRVFMGAVSGYFWKVRNGQIKPNSSATKPVRKRPSATRDDDDIPEDVRMMGWDNGEFYK